MTLLAPPGVYTIKLTVGGKDFAQKLTVIKDPHSAGTESHLRAQFAFLEALRSNLNAAADLVNQVEILRKQVEDLKPRLNEEAATLDTALINFEENLHQLRITGGQDGMRWPAKLIEKSAHIASQLQENDFTPTAQQIAVGQQLNQQIRDLRRQFDDLLSKDVVRFNEALKQYGIPPLTIGKAR